MEGKEFISKELAIGRVRLKERRLVEKSVIMADFLRQSPVLQMNELYSVARYVYIHIQTYIQEGIEKEGY